MRKVPSKGLCDEASLEVVEMSLKNNTLDYVDFKLSLIALLATLFFSTILLSIFSQATSVTGYTSPGMERTWVIDLIIVKFEGFNW